jgi:hypothetical protein
MVKEPLYEFLTQRREGAKKIDYETRKIFAPLRLCAE